jgi:hypothetical protein
MATDLCSSCFLLLRNKKTPSHNLMACLLPSHTTITRKPMFSLVCDFARTDSASNYAVLPLLLFCSTTLSKTEHTLQQNDKNSTR